MDLEKLTKEERETLAKIEEKLSHYKIRKILSSSFSEIDRFQNTTTYKCKIDDCKLEEDCTFRLNKQDRQIIFTSSSNYFEKQGKLITVCFFTDDVNYKCEDSIIKSISFDLPIPVYTVDLSNIKKGTPSKYFRMLLPIDNSLNLINLFDTCGYRIDKYGVSSGLMIVNSETCEYHIYEEKFHNQLYLIIDSMNEITYDAFYNYTLNILLALGVLTGSFIQDQCYIISSEDNNFEQLNYFEFKPLRESKKATYNVLPTNPHLYFEPKDADSKRDMMAHINSEQFLTLINCMTESKILFNALFIFVESYSYPLDTKPACLSVVLEGLYQFLEKRIDDKFRPIKDLNQADKLRNDLLSKLTDYEPYFEPTYGKTMIQNKINDLNKLSNTAGFQKAFELFNIQLKEYEKETLKNRNSFLHCNEKIYDKHILTKSYPEEFANIYFTEENLTKLLYILILKIIGYAVVESFLETHNRVRHLIENLNNSLNFYNRQVFEKYKETPSVWSIVEMLGFSDFIDFYAHYYQYFHLKCEYTPHFDSVRRLRNAAAHNTCMISNLKPQNWFKSDIEINFELLGAKLDVGNGVISSCLKVPVLNDFAVMLSNYVKLISSPKIKEKTLEEIQDFFNGRMILHKDYFENVNEIKNAYHFAKAVLDFYSQK